MALAKSDWAVDRHGPLAAALKTPLSSLCAWSVGRSVGRSLESCSVDVLKGEISLYGFLHTQVSGA